MIIKTAVQCLYLIIFGYFSFLFFSKILGTKKNPKAALTIIIIYLVFFDYLFLGRVFFEFLSKRAVYEIQYNLIYFLQITITQVLFTAIIIFLFKGDIFKKLAACIVYFIIWQLVQYVMLSSFQRCYDLIIGNTKGGQIPLLALILIELLRYFVTCFMLYIIPKKCGNLSCKLPEKISLLLFIPSLFILLITEFIVFVCNHVQVFHMLYVLNETPKAPFLFYNIDILIIVIISIMGLCSDIIIVFGINNEIKELFKREQLEMQVKHYEDLEENSEKLKALRHDMKNHMLTALGLLKDGHAVEAEKYMKSFISESCLFKDRIQSGNKAVDAIIEAKLVEAKKFNVSIKCNMKIPKLNHISDFDLCTILGNAIDNAIEACEKVEDNKRFIVVESSVVRSYFLIEIKNSSCEKNMCIDTLKSKKDNKKIHGIGLENIRAAIIKNHGMININLENYIFSLSVMLPVNRLEH